jgi:sec-independent protein translocase protein TatC
VVDEPLSVISVGEGFFVEMRASFLAALFVSAPWTLWQVWGFVSPGLYARERRLAIPFVFFTSLFFIAGGAFGYYVGWPAILDYLIGTASQGYEKNIRAQGYMDLLTKVLLGMGLVFEAPVLSAFLARLGLVSAGWLLRYWKHAMVGIAILAAFITPSGDIPTMVVFAVPMVLLYLVSVAVAWALGRRRGTASGA